MMRVRLVIMLALFALASGCYESPEATGFEPGVYKGKSDPLLQGDAAERAATLKERFNTVQAAQ